MPKYPGIMNLGSHHEISIVANSLGASFGYTPDNVSKSLANENSCCGLKSKIY